MEQQPLDRLWTRSRMSLRARLQRLRDKGFQVAQCAVAAGLAWFIAADLFDHDQPFIAPIAAVVCLGTSYGQRVRRVLEVMIGVAVGVLIADLLVLWLGSGPWQLALIVALAMGAALLLDAGTLFVTQAAVQSIVIATLVADSSTAFIRWTDALIGGGVALLAATVVPAAPLRRPRESAARVARKISEMLRAAAQVMKDGEIEPALDLLADARQTDHLIRALQSAADEGLSVIASSPFRLRHKPDLRKMVDLVAPLDKALRSARVLTRRTAVVAHRRRPVPASYAALCLELADACDEVAVEFSADRRADAARPALMAVAAATGRVERTSDMSVDMVLAQMRSLVADLLELTGLDALEATDHLPPVRDVS